MVDHAGLLVNAELPIHVRRSRGDELLELAIAQLPDPARLLNLARNSDEAHTKRGVAEDLLRTNNFQLSVDGQMYTAVFPEVSVCSSLLS